MRTSSEGPTPAAIEAVFRLEAPRLIGGLLRIVRDVAVGEDIAQDALVIALERWPSTGIPENPGAWLMTTAKNRAVDHIRHGKMADRNHQVITSSAVAVAVEPDEEAVGDDLLRLVLVSCHPVLSTQARVALTLRLLGGLTTGEIAKAFLVAEPTIAQRIVRAKRSLTEARVPFEVPRGAELSARLPAVLEVIYLIFNEGYAAATDERAMRPELCRNALRLGRVLAGLVPDEGEAHGLVALMELHASRMRARVDADGQPVLLFDQDRSRWDHLLIRRGLDALARAEALEAPLGPYALQAAISACHARARTPDETDWVRIVALYDALVELTGSPVVELNRAVAVGMAFGPAEALPLVDELAEEEVLRDYHLVPSVRADLLKKLGRLDEARTEYRRAAAMATNPRDAEQLVGLAERCGD
ncbi:MAG: RNA polymerase sigma factor [Polyangiaceae bacterium]